MRSEGSLYFRTLLNTKYAHNRNTNLNVYAGKFTHQYAQQKYRLNPKVFVHSFLQICINYPLLGKGRHQKKNVYFARIMWELLIPKVILPKMANFYLKFTII